MTRAHNCRSCVKCATCCCHKLLPACPLICSNLFLMPQQSLPRHISDLSSSASTCTWPWSAKSTYLSPSSLSSSSSSSSCTSLMLHSAVIFFFMLSTCLLLLFSAASFFSSACFCFFFLAAGRVYCSSLEPPRAGGPVFPLALPALLTVVLSGAFTTHTHTRFTFGFVELLMSLYAARH